MTTYIRVSEGLRYKRDCGREKVQAEGHCRMCLRPSAELVDLWQRPDAVRVMTRHHLVPKRYFKQNGYEHLRDVDANLVPLCRACHNLVERRGDEGRIARRMLRRLLTQTEIAFVLQMRGKAWLDIRYPISEKTEVLALAA